MRKAARDVVAGAALGWHNMRRGIVVTEQAPETVTLYRPVGPEELELIEASGNREFPLRLPDQPIFYPVCNERYAVEIAEKWNVRDSGAGFVTRFEVRADYLRRYEPQIAGRRYHEEYWIPAEDLPAFNAAIVGEIEVIKRFPPDAKAGP